MSRDSKQYDVSEDCNGLDSIYDGHKKLILGMPIYLNYVFVTNMCIGTHDLAS